MDSTRSNRKTDMTITAVPTESPGTEHALGDQPGRVSLLEVNPAKTRMENIDALRTLCMLAIIASHNTAPYLMANHSHPTAIFSLIMAINVATKFGVPCFLIISFYIYWHQLYEKKRTWPELLKRRLKRIVPAFLFWSTVYFMIYKTLWVVTGHNFCQTLDLKHLSWKSPELWLRVYFLGQAEYHLYYLPVVIECMLLIPLLRLLWRRPVVSWAVVGVLVGFWYLAAYGEAAARAIGQSPEIFIALRAFLHDQLTVPLLVYPILGMMFAGQVPWRRWLAHTPLWTLWGLLTFGIILHVIEAFLAMNYNYEYALLWLKAGQLITGIAMFALILRHPLMRNRFPLISHHAFGLHFMHPLIILALFLLERRFLGDAIADWHVYSVPMIVLNFLVVFSITFGLCRLISRVRSLEFLVV